jgi:GNAT superfamily N-acetyltransferase
LYGHLEKINYFSTNDLEAEVEVVYLKSNARGKNVAKHLVNEFTKWAKHNSAFRIKAGIYDKNYSSQKLFEKIGFNAYHTTYTLDLKKK